MAGLYARRVTVASTMRRNARNVSQLKLASLFAVLVLCMAGCKSAAPLPDTSSVVPSDARLVARGAQLAAVGDCHGCHTRQGGGPYAGGLPMSSPWGTIYSTNITPDKDTGIGTWSREAFARASLIVAIR